MNKIKMSNYKDQIVRVLEKATGIKNSEVDFASDSQFGDYSSNICLRNKDLDPQKIANEINGKDLQFSAKVVGKFINFWLKKDILIYLKELLEYIRDMSMIKLKR